MPSASGHGVSQATPQPTTPRPTHALAASHPAYGGHTDRDPGQCYPVHHQQASSHPAFATSATSQARAGPLVAPPPPPPPPAPGAPSGPELPLKTKKKRRSASGIGYIWPKDPRPGNTGRWAHGSRFKDVLTGKGPDMYVGRIGIRPEDKVTVKAKPGEKANERYRWESEKYWSLWGHEHELHCTAGFCDDCDRIEEQRVKDSLLTSARRGPSERYDYRMRKYQVPDEGTWSDVKFCEVRTHAVPTAFRDHMGARYPANQWHDTIYGLHTD
ncbi:hypothetical protein BJY01DRAFT_245752 [Aspergillus pseudoustus]|uniref:Cryptic loci regulator 2 N-terminal domain-containing protein n=1 Tax=Aspergillus pseudoustus TaxID=1810923 RepID=A0ABR4KC07_9EURO